MGMRYAIQRKHDIPIVAGYARISGIEIRSVAESGKTVVFTIINYDVYKDKMTRQSMPNKPILVGERVKIMDWVPVAATRLALYKQVYRKLAQTLKITNVQV